MTDPLSWAGTFDGIDARLLREYVEQISLNPAFTIHDREDSADLMNLVRHERRLLKTESRFLTSGRPLRGTISAATGELPHPLALQLQPKRYPAIFDILVGKAPDFRRFLLGCYTLTVRPDVDCKNFIFDRIPEERPGHRAAAHKIPEGSFINPTASRTYIPGIPTRRGDIPEPPCAAANS